MVLRMTRRRTSEPLTVIFIHKVWTLRFTSRTSIWPHQPIIILHFYLSYYIHQIRSSKPIWVQVDEKLSQNWWNFIQSSKIHFFFPVVWFSEYYETTLLSLLEQNHRFWIEIRFSLVSKDWELNFVIFGGKFSTPLSNSPHVYSLWSSSLVLVLKRINFTLHSTGL